jgi:hypothetical protein
MLSLRYRIKSRHGETFPQAPARIPVDQFQLARKGEFHGITSRRFDWAVNSSRCLFGYSSAAFSSMDSSSWYFLQDRSFKYMADFILRHVQCSDTYKLGRAHSISNFEGFIQRVQWSDN